MFVECDKIFDEWIGDNDLISWCKFCDGYSCFLLFKVENKWILLWLFDIGKVCFDFWNVRIDDEGVCFLVLMYFEIKCMLDFFEILFLVGFI